MSLKVYKEGDDCPEIHRQGGMVRRGYAKRDDEGNPILDDKGRRIIEFEEKPCETCWGTLKVKEQFARFECTKDDIDGSNFR